MDYKKIKVPFLHNEEIKNKADLFRKKYWNNSVPIDIERIIDFKLEINLIPKSGLQVLCDTDALITSDWQSIYVVQIALNELNNT